MDLTLALFGATALYRPVMDDHQGDPTGGLTFGELKAILEQNLVPDDASIHLEVWARTEKAALNDLEERRGRVRVELDEVSVTKRTSALQDTPETVIQLIGNAVR